MGLFGVRLPGCPAGICVAYCVICPFCAFCLYSPLPVHCISQSWVSSYSMPKAIVAMFEKHLSSIFLSVQIRSFTIHSNEKVQLIYKWALERGLATSKAVLQIFVYVYVYCRREQSGNFKPICYPATSSLFACLWIGLFSSLYLPKKARMRRSVRVIVWGSWRTSVGFSSN